MPLLKIDDDYIYMHMTIKVTKQMSSWWKCNQLSLKLDIEKITYVYLTGKLIKIIYSQMKTIVPS